MLLCQIEMRALEDAERAPAYYIVGRYGFESDLQEGDDLWINWQIADHNFEVKTRVTSQKKRYMRMGKVLL